MRHCHPPFFDLSGEGKILAPEEIWSQLNALKSSIAVRAVWPALRSFWRCCQSVKGVWSGDFLVYDWFLL